VCLRFQTCSVDELLTQLATTHGLLALTERSVDRAHTRPLTEPVLLPVQVHKTRFRPTSMGHHQEPFFLLRMRI
jgi:hypothetical protein